MPRFLRLVHSVPEPEEPTGPCCPGCGANPYGFHGEACDVGPEETIYSGDPEADFNVWNDDDAYDDDWNE